MSSGTSGLDWRVGLVWVALLFSISFNVIDRLLCRSAEPPCRCR